MRFTKCSGIAAIEATEAKPRMSSQDVGVSHVFSLDICLGVKLNVSRMLLIVSLIIVDSGTTPKAAEQFSDLLSRN